MGVLLMGIPELDVNTQFSLRQSSEQWPFKLTQKGKFESNSMTVSVLFR